MKKLQVKYLSDKEWRDVNGQDHHHPSSVHHPDSDFHAAIRIALDSLWPDATITVNNPTAPIEYRLVEID